MEKYLQITIYEALKHMHVHEYLLPSIQRKFVWKPRQIELLFDSLLQGYPIGSFMLWKVQDAKLQKEYTFYRFLQRFYDRQDNENEVQVALFPGQNFWAVVDGQQRLSSFYLGIFGTLETNVPYRKEEKLEKRLYLNLSESLVEDDEKGKKYDFQFKTREVAENDARRVWFLVEDILKDKEYLEEYLNEHGLQDNIFAKETLSLLKRKISEEDLINYYEITEQDEEKVLEMFVRANSGGTKLSHSDLFMSRLEDNWKNGSIRKEIKSLRNQVRKYNFEISQDFVLKCMLMLSDSPVRFSGASFRNVYNEDFQGTWKNVRKSIEATFAFLQKFGFTDQLVSAKNAVIPIIYYVYKNDLNGKITNEDYDYRNREIIAKWLNLSLLKRIFSGHVDSSLEKIRHILQDTKDERFPFAEIVAAFSGIPDKNYNLDDEVVKNLLYSEYSTSKSDLVLMLLYPEVVYRCGGKMNRDHLHPKTYFNSEKKLTELSVNLKTRKIIARTYNTTLNLQLLNENQNKSKGRGDLEGWVKRMKQSGQEVKNGDLMLDEGVGLDVESYASFIKSREKNMKKRLLEMLSM